MKFRFSLSTLILFSLLTASIGVHLARYCFQPIRPPSKFPQVDGSFIEAKYIDIDSNDRLYFRYGPINDSGVEIERVRDGQTIWIVFVERLNVGHSEYVHDVRLDAKNWKATGTFEVISEGSYGRIEELRSISDGKPIDRQDYFREYQMRPGFPPDWKTIAEHLSAWERSSSVYWSENYHYQWKANKFNSDQETMFIIATNPPPQMVVPTRSGKYFILPPGKWVDNIGQAVSEWKTIE